MRTREMVTCNIYQAADVWIKTMGFGYCGGRKWDCSTEWGTGVVVLLLCFSLSQCYQYCIRARCNERRAWGWSVLYLFALSYPWGARMACNVLLWGETWRGRRKTEDRGVVVVPIKGRTFFSVPFFSSPDMKSDLF